ncbi:hypothetical protein [Bacillus sp. UNCCL81]|nr:hypothetical protein [Bacillus sp. UNCCL81]
MGYEVVRSKRIMNENTQLREEIERLKREYEDKLASFIAKLIQETVK